MWDREMERWDEERLAWSKREQFLLNQISGLQALVVSIFGLLHAMWTFDGIMQLFEGVAIQCSS